MCFGVGHWSILMRGARMLTCIGVRTARVFEYDVRLKSNRIYILVVNFLQNYSTGLFM